jgi:hypothetical protein
MAPTTKDVIQTTTMLAMIIEDSMMRQPGGC